MIEDVTLPTIPVFDIRAVGPVGRALENPDRLAALREACLSSLPRAFRPVLPVLEVPARRWLKSCRSPYLAEVEAIAAAVSFSGVWFLNGS